jgi:ABC-type dipeptide/oligopeptide/nickel transport system permease subunit
VTALKESEFVTSARMVGAGEWRILRVHILPHVMPLMLAYSAFLVATTILMEAGLSFLKRRSAAADGELGFGAHRCLRDLRRRRRVDAVRRGSEART